MNPEELKQNIALYYSKLPPNVQAMFSSMSWLETLKRISAKYALSNVQIETLGTETTLVLLGIIHLDEYEATLRRELTLPSKESMDSLLAEINSLIISPIRPELGNAFNNNIKGDPERAQELDERFKKLSPNIQDAIAKSNYQEILYSISQENKLNVEQIGILEAITVDVMLGIVEPSKFEESLKQKLQIPIEKVQKIVNEVNEKILKKIRENMMAPPPRVAPTVAPGSTVHTLKDDMQTLKRAGIEIIPHTTDKEEMLKKEWHLDSVNKPAPAPGAMPNSIGAQKLAGTFQIPKAETNYAIKNLSSSGTPKVPTNNVTLKVDPYREVPE
ncbi:MAG: hypothetical protein Q8O46_01430 [bacterium]|nr:hypothetical protein [bacterium]